QSPGVLPDATTQLMYDFWRNTMIQFNITNLDQMFNAPLSYFRPTMQVMQAPAVTVNSHFAMQDNQEGKKFKVPLVLEENAVWDLTVAHTVASAGGLDNHFLLFGWYREMLRKSGSPLSDSVYCFALAASCGQSSLNSFSPSRGSYVLHGF